MQQEQYAVQTIDAALDNQPSEGMTMIYCPECGAGPIAFQEGCFLCLSCGHTKCS